MKEILIDVYHNALRVAVTEEEKLVEYWSENAASAKMMGNIYKGRVENFLSGMQAAFVNIGLSKNGFLYAGDTLLEGGRELSAGDIIMCQVVKDEFGTKGARLTMNVSLPGRYLVMMPKFDYIAVSRKIEDENTKNRLSDLIKKHRSAGFGYVARTKAADAGEIEIIAEIDELAKKWEKVVEKFERRPPCSVLFSEEDLITRVTRDMLDGTVERIITNDKRVFEDINEEVPEANIELYTGAENLLSSKKLSRQIDNLLKRKVPLKNGGYLIFDRTEALTVIDVNTGRYVGENDLENTVLSTNLAAAAEIARQLRLRNIGGIVIIDFIDMQDEKNRNAVLETLAAELKKDPVHTNLVGMTPLCLVELTRKKTRGMLEGVMLQTCPYCGGEGVVLSDERVIEHIKNHISKLFLEDASAQSVLLTVNPQVAAKIFALRYLEQESEKNWAGRRVYVVPEGGFHIETYNTEKLSGGVLTLPNNARLLY